MKKNNNKNGKELTSYEMRHYRGKAVVEIRIACKSPEDVQQAREAVMYHFELLQPVFQQKRGQLVVRMLPLDPSLFGWQEGLDILRLTLAQSLPGTQERSFALLRKGQAGDSGAAPST